MYEWNLSTMLKLQWSSKKNCFKNRPRQTGIPRSQTSSFQGHSCHSNGIFPYGLEKRLPVAQFRNYELAPLCEFLKGIYRHNLLLKEDKLCPDYKTFLVVVKLFPMLLKMYIHFYRITTVCTNLAVYLIS